MLTQSNSTYSSESTDINPIDINLIEKIYANCLKIASLVENNQCDQIRSLINNLYTFRELEGLVAFTEKEIRLIVELPELIKEGLIKQQKSFVDKEVLQFLFNALKKANELGWDNEEGQADAIIQNLKLQIMSIKTLKSCIPGATTFGEDYQDKVISNLDKIINNPQDTVECFEYFVAKKIMEFCQEKYNQLEDQHGMSLKDFLFTDTFREQLKAEKRGNWLIQGSLHITKLLDEFKNQGKELSTSQEELISPPSPLTSLASALCYCGMSREGKQK